MWFRGSRVRVPLPTPYDPMTRCLPQRVMLRVRPVFLIQRIQGRRQAVRHRPLTPTFAGSNPAVPAKYSITGFERRLLKTIRWIVLTAVAFPQKSESTLLLVGAKSALLRPFVLQKAIRPLPCSSSPNHKRCAGLCLGFQAGHFFIRMCAAAGLWAGTDIPKW